MSTGKIELSVGSVKIANKYELFTEAEVDAINNKVPELDGRVGNIEDEIEEINSSLDNMESEKASKLEVDIERKRIDLFTKLPNGSTSGDAELMDARVGIDGTTYNNLGGAIRTQLNKVTDELNYFCGKEIKMIDNHAIDTNVGIGNVVNLTPSELYGCRYSIVSCKEGDTFRISGEGGENPRLWAFIDSNNKLLSISTSTLIANNLSLIAPKTASKLIINDKDGTRNSYIGGEIIDATIGIDGAIRPQLNKVTDELNYFCGKEIKMIDNHAIDTNVGIGNVVNLTPSELYGCRYSIVSCKEGDTFRISGEGGENPRLWAFIDSNNKLLSISTSTLIANNLSLIAPKTASKLIINDKDGTRNSYIGGEIIDATIGIVGTVAKRLEENIFSTTKLLTDVKWVLKHIDVPGTICDNDNKNVVTEDMHLLKSGTTITVDLNYKFQIALYDKATKTFIKRITWLQGGYIYKLDGDYYVRIEISDNNETVQSDTSISSHVKVIIAENIIEKNSNDIKELNTQISNQADKLIDVFGIDTFKRRQLTITNKNKYSAWPMITSLNNKLYCIYTRVGYHEDYSSSEICLKTSNNGVIWSDEKIIINNSNNRASLTGIGVIDNKVAFLVRTGSKYELYILDSNNNPFKISTLTTDFSYGHISNIISVPTVGLMAFYNTYETNRRWGIFVSTDNGVTWTQKNIEIPTSNSECPTEISGVYLQDGKILAIGRKDIGGNTNAQFQIQSSDYGNTWTKEYTNITDIALSTPSLIYNQNTNEISNYYFQRGTALRLRKNNINDVWDTPTNWSNSEILADSGGHMEDEGNVNANEYNGSHFVTYYMGESNSTGIYEVII